MKVKLLLQSAILLIIFLCANRAFADITGKISGKVVESNKKDPIPGVSVILEGTKLGAATNISGQYIINNIPPGVYNIVFSAVGFQKQVLKGVKIASDFTTKLATELNEEAVEMNAVVIEAQTPLIRNDLTSSQAIIDVSQIEALPVESISQVLALQAGVTQGAGGEIHIRGGRANEINYTVNGVSISNPFNNSPMVEIATNAIQELSIVSGTFNAEYGNALSGIVNTVTKEGGNKYNGHISFYTGDRISNRTDRFSNIGEIKPLNSWVGEATFGGPIPFTNEMLSFFFSGRVDSSQGWLYGKREHNPWDSVFINQYNPNDIRIASSGDNAIVPMNPSFSYSLTGKLTFKPIATVKINYDFIYSKSRYSSYSHEFRFNPDANYNNYDWGMTNALDIRHAISGSTFYSVKAAYNVSDFKQYLYPLVDASGSPVTFYAGMDMTGLKPDPRYQPTEKLTVPTQYSFSYGGTRMGHYYERAKKMSFKFDMNSQLSMNHELKFGSELNLNELHYQSFTILKDTNTYKVAQIPSSTTTNHNVYSKYPVLFSAYVQDKMEYESFILNIGIRYDYFAPKSKYSTNILYPTPNDPLIPDYINKNDLLQDAKAKHQVSPRIGISFPITDKGIIHLSYGHFYQMPSFSSLYTNPDYKYSLASGSMLYGNPNLDPEKTVTYEIGLQQQLFEDLAFNVTGFFKDVRGLLATEVIRVSGDKTYSKFVNKDYGNIKGLTFSLTKRRTKADRLGFTLDYTFQVAEGNDVNSDAFFLDLSSGRQSEKVLIFLGWDQSHTLNSTVSYGFTDDFNVSLIGKIGSGLPYTPQIYGNQVYIRTNSERKPFYATVDMMAQKDFSLWGYTVSVFLKIVNLFDFLMERYVYNDSGRATYTLLETSGTTKSIDQLVKNVPGAHTAAEYFNRPEYFYPPREVRLGFSIDF